MPRAANLDIEYKLNLAELPENKEDFQLMWLDAHLTESAEARATQKTLRLLNTNAQFYTNSEKCLEIILSIQTEHVLLVVSGSLARIILPQIENIRSVRAIFVFCEKAELHSNLLHEYQRKIVGVYADQNKLVEAISETMELIDKQDMVFRLFDGKQKSTRDLTKESASFLWNQLLIDVLRKMPTDDQAKNEMLDYCSAYYRNNREELKKIQDFRTSYTPYDAIKYYTANSFLYKLLNKALRTEDITLLYTFRFFIIDLCARLDEEKEKLIEKESGPLTLYRGQQIPKEEFENLKNNVGSLIATNGFLSTSRDERISLGFSMLPLSPLGANMIQVQMIIKADPTTLKKVTFADVSRQSKFDVEQEVLFSLGAVFRIDKCEFDESLSIGKILLTATDEGSATLQSYLDAQNHQLQVYTPLIYFGRLLMLEMNEVDRADEYFQMLLKTLPSDHPDVAEVYNQIGGVHYMNAHKLTGQLRNTQLDCALEMFCTALNMRKKMYGDNDIRIAASFNNIGSVYNDHREFDLALNYYERGLEIIENLRVEANIMKANLLSNCGILRQKMNDDEAAFSLFIRADDIYSQILPIHHPTSQQNALRIAELCEKIGDHSRARQYFVRVFEYCQSMLLPTDEQFKTSWISVVRYSFKLDFEQEAITYLNQVLKMCERSSSYTQETRNTYVWYMAQICEDAMKFDLALNYYKTLFQSDGTNINDLSSVEWTEDNIDYVSSTKHIEILKFRLSVYEQLFPINTVQHVPFLMEIGAAFEACQSIDLAYQCYQKAFDIYEAAPTLADTITFRDCWAKLIGKYVDNNDEQSMLSILARVLKISKEISNDTMSGARCLQHIADRYEMNNDNPRAEYYLEKAFTYAETTGSGSDVRVQLEKLFEFYMEKEQEQKLEIYIQRAINVCEKDPVELCKCHWKLGDLYKNNGMKDKSLQYYEYLLVATERNDLPSKQVLDNIWIDFVLVDRSESFRFGPVGESFYLSSLVPICQRHLPSPHFKEAILRWKAGALHESIKMTTAALESYFYPSVTETFEKLIYERNDTRTKQALQYFLSQYDIYIGTHACCSWLKSSRLSYFATFSAAGAHEKWKCILQRLKMLKMAHIDNQWEFHLKIEYSVSDPKLCKILINEFLQICQTELLSDENNFSLDIHSIICCLEFLSHWSFNRKQFLEGLLYRQYQLEYETKIFKEHPHVAWSLWFIGLIFQQMNEYDSALGYLDRALKMFEHEHCKEHNDIQKLEELISQIKQMVNTTNISQVNQSCINIIDNKQIKSNPKMLQRLVHID